MISPTPAPLPPTASRPSWAYEAAKNLTFYEANVLDRDAMNKIFDTHQIDRVIHFAGF